MTESQERFVRAVLERLPASRIVEMHLFPALRQGGAETGVAVIAGRRDGAGDGGGASEPGATEGSASEGGPTDGSASDGDGSGGAEATQAAAAGGAPPEGQGTAEPSAGHHRSDAAGAGSPTAAASPGDPAAPARAPAARARRRRASRPAGRAAPGEPGERHTVFTARYRLTIRGPDRGKWEFDLVEEADAPLVTVDAVVRGVQERAGEEGEPARLGPDALAALAAGRGAPWTTATR